MLRAYLDSALQHPTVENFLVAVTDGEVSVLNFHFAVSDVLNPVDGDGVRLVYSDEQSGVQLIRQGL